jgi:hypothetical protein
MATIGSNSLTLIDYAKRFGDDGKIEPIVELLSQTNDILDDMLWIEGNLQTGHKTSVRTGIPQATWRLLYQGAQPTKSTTSQITDTCGMLETYSVIDKDLADLNGNAAAFRLSEDSAFIEGMSQQFAQTLIYGNIASNPERFQGLAPRFNTLLTANAQTANNVISGGGSVGGQQTSIWLIVWGDNTVHGIFPKGAKAGLLQDDVTTKAPVSDGAGGLYQAYQTKYQWKCGLTVRDWRYVVRICNIDVPALAGGSPVNLQRLFIRAMNKVPNLKKGRAVFYVNRAVRTWADIQQTEKPTLGFSMLQNVQGEPMLAFRGIPLKLCDQILTTEAVIV